MKNPQKILAFILLASLCLGLSACGKKPPEQNSAPPEEKESEAQKTAGDPDKKAILVVSFGTSYNETRAVTIEAIEGAVTKAFPDYEVRRAFTSQIIIDKLEERDGLEIDNVKEAMERLIADGVGTLVVQPTHVMNGFEYDEMKEAIAPYEDSFKNISYGLPLLISDEDYAEVVSILADETAEYNTDDTAIVFMGHGTEHEANSTYAKLQQKFDDAGYTNYFIGTVEAEPTLEDVVAAVEKTGAKKVVLLPLMIVAGDHANNDMAGDEEGSWKTEFKAAGYEVEPVLKGLGQYEGIQKMFVEHVQAAVDALKA